MRLDAATVLLQWATGGLFFLWVTTRRREVGLGYGWLLRGVFLVMAAGAAAALAAGNRGGGRAGLGEGGRLVGGARTRGAPCNLDRPARAAGRSPPPHRRG